MFDPEYTITLYFNDAESLTQDDIDQLSDWIEQSDENAAKFIQASLMHRAIYDYLVGADTNKNIMLDLAEAAGRPAGHSHQRPGRFGGSRCHR